MSQKLVAAQVLAKIWGVAEKSPGLKKLAKELVLLGSKSKVLNHPFAQLDRGFVFIHVPKTAGTSLRQALGLNAPLTTQCHASAREVVPFVKEVAPSAISIAFVRNPFTRFISLYNFARMDESLYHSVSHPDRAPYGKHEDYDTLVDKSLEECAELLIQGKLGSPCAVGLTTWHPQIEWLTDERGHFIVDFVGHVESIDSDLKRLREKHGITCGAMPWLNRSTPPQREPILTERARDLLKLYYKRDFERLGYDEDWAPGSGSALRAESTAGATPILRVA